MSRRGGTRPWSLLSPPRSRAPAHGCSTRMSTRDHNRAVITLVGDDRGVEEGLVAGIDEARRRVDLRTHDGVHPRVGAADVVPVVPLAAADLGRAVDVALAVGARVGDELGLPVFLYGEIGDGRRPAFFRRGGPGELQRRVDAGELEPAFGPRRLDPAAGAVLLGVRAPLVAFNLELRGTLDVARDVAAAVRESSGGLPGVQALGLRLGAGRIQVSTNVVDLDATPPHVMVERIVARGSGAWGRGRGGGARRAAACSLRRGRRVGRGDRESARRPRRSGAGGARRRRAGVAAPASRRRPCGRVASPPVSAASDAKSAGTRHEFGTKPAQTRDTLRDSVTPGSFAPPRGRASGRRRSSRGRIPAIADLRH